MAVPNPGPSRPPPVNPVVIGESGRPSGANFDKLPSHKSSCPCQPDEEIVAAPGVALAVEHDFGAARVAAAGELQRQDPRTRREAQIGQERRCAQVLALRHRIERVQQREDAFRLVAHVVRDRDRRGQRVGWRLAIPPGRGGEEAVAGIGFTRVAQPASTLESVAKLAIVGVWVLLRPS